MKTKALLVFCFLLFGSIASAAPKVVHLFLDGPIHAITSEYVIKGIDDAEKENADLCIVQIQTPGGVMDSMRSIISRMLSSKVPVVVYVAPSGARATSAGFFITIAADLAVMAPGTHLGSAHPVTIGGEGDKDDENSKTMMKKATEDAVAYIKTLSAHRGRNVELSEKAVRDSISFTETEALKSNLIDFVAKDVPELLQKANGKTIQRFDGSQKILKLEKATVVEYPMTRRQRFLSFLADPNITVLLFSIGMIGILLELYHPGAILPGVVGVISIALCLLSAEIFPINYIGAMLILFAIVLFILELKVTSYGILTLGGIVSFVLGATMLFDAPIPEMRISMKVIATSVLLIVATMAFLLTMVVTLHRRKPLTGIQGLLQEIGTAQTEIHQFGQVFVHGEIWNATANNPIPKGEKVKIVSVDGLTLHVERQP